MLQVCDALYRVLRDDGTFWVVIGDSFCSTDKWGGGKSGNTGKHTVAQNGDVPSWTIRQKRQAIPGLSPKSLMMMPARFAIALQARGWTLRSEIPWLKVNSMPSSVQDRPSVSHETVFLFSKGPRYFWDADAIRKQSSPFSHPLGPNGGPRRKTGARHHTHPDVGQSGTVGHALDQYTLGASRNRRTGDWWYESLDQLIADTDAWLAHAKHVRAHGGMLLSPDGEPLGLNVNPKAFSGAHFACFPEALVRPLVLASTSERGACSKCQAPWQRVVEHHAQPNALYGSGGGTKAEFSEATRLAGGIGRMDGGRRAVNGSSFNNNPAKRPEAGQTLGWRPTCAHYPYVEKWREVPPQLKGEDEEAYQERILPVVLMQWQLLKSWEHEATVPCTILDPFGGAGTSAVVARPLGRKSILIELSESYCQLTVKRLRQQMLPFADVQEPVSSNGHDAMQAEMTFDA